jgi:hypothetical protein
MHQLKNHSLPAEPWEQRIMLMENYSKVFSG